MLCFPIVCGAQDPDVIPLKSEPHHHLVLHNDFANVYSVQVQPHDSVLLHKHMFDAIGIMLGDAEITVSAPGKPDSHQKIGGGQLRLQQAGYIHSTVIDGDTAYHNMTVGASFAAARGSQHLCPPNVYTAAQLPISVRR